MTTRRTEQKFQRTAVLAGSAPGVFNLQEEAGGRKYAVTTSKDGTILRAELNPDTPRVERIQISDDVPVIGLAGGAAFLVMAESLTLEQVHVVAGVASNGATGLEVDIVWQADGWTDPVAAGTSVLESTITMTTKDSGLIPSKDTTNDFVITSLNVGDLLLLYVKSDDGGTKAQNVQAFLKFS